jgi:hypothetical protein
MSTWYVRVAVFEHYRIEAERPEDAASEALTASRAASDARGNEDGFVMVEDLGHDVTATDEDGDPIGEAAVMGGEFPPVEITGGGGPSV